MGITQSRALEYVSFTQSGHSSGMPPAPIRWILVRDPSGERDPQAFLAPIVILTPSQSSAASYSVGGSRQPFKSFASTTASRRNGSGPIWPSCAQPRRCSAYIPWWLSGRMG